MRWSRRSRSTTSKGKHDEKGKGSEYVQIAGQEASNKQSADADAVAFQVKPSNTNESVRVLSPGHDGDVTQSNTAKAVGLAANGNETKQSIDQTQAGSGGSSTQVAGQACEEPPGRRRGCDGRSVEAEQHRLVDPRPRARATAATSRSRTTLSRSARR